MAIPGQIGDGNERRFFTFFEEQTIGWSATNVQTHGVPFVENVTSALCISMAIMTC